MKTLKLFSLVSAALLGFTQPILAGPHGGGGGGFSGGGFGGGGRGGGFRGGGFGGGHFGGGGFGGPHMAFGGAVNRGGGVGFGMPSPGVPYVATRPAQVRSSVPSRQPVVRGSRGNSTRGLTNVARGNRRGNTSGRTTTALNRPNNRGTNPSTTRPSQTSLNRGLNGRTDHISERHEANWHRDWDRRHAHFDHDRFFVFEDGFWFGLDDGFFPWDYLPYYADDYYPYDYYTDDQPYNNNGVPVADPTVQATQTQLTQLGYYNGPVDGIFGPATRDALAKYQIDNQLSVTGSLSPDTLQSLGLPQPVGS